MDLRELAWAAGLFEGEGSISTQPHSGTQGVIGVQVALAMNDEDVVRRFHAAVGMGTVTHGRLWRWNANSFQNCQAVVAMLWFGLGERRRNRAQEVFSIVQATRANLRYHPLGKECSRDGCDRTPVAKGECGLHYQRTRKALLYA